jgi:WD40 repeat protein/predicted Ser/Thr protein kinase
VIEVRLETTQFCPKCRRLLPARAPHGLCSGCLAARLLDPDVESIDTMNLEGGRRFGDFELQNEIARGGMGVIYMARQISLNRPVALKFVAGMHAAPDFIERFQIEAEAAASLHHPNIVPIYEFGEHDGQPYFSMRPLRESLDKRVAKSPLSLRAAAELVIKMARAAHFAHQRGIIHRDIKPSNILLDEAGEPFLADFGLAKLIERNSALTHTRAMLGTPAYISPEQASGDLRGVTTAADVYSLGAVLYELISGVPPFAGGTTLETVRMVVEKEPKRPSTLNRAVDRDLETICLHCLKKNPRARYASAESLAEDLERWLAGEPITARRVGAGERVAKWVRRHPAGTLAIATFIGALVAISIISTRAGRKLAVMGEDRRQRLVRLNISEAERLTDAGDFAGALHWQLQAMELEHDDDAARDRQRRSIGALLRGAPQVEQMFFHAGPVNFAVFSPDGRRIATASDDRTACLWDAATGKRLGEPMVHSGPVYLAQFSPDGKTVVTASDDGTARVWNAFTGRAVTPEFACATIDFACRRPLMPGPVFRPDGQAVLTRAGKTAQIWSAATGEKLGGAFRHDALVTQASFSPDGRQVVTASEDRTAKLWSAAEPSAPLFTLLHPAKVEGASFSPNGKKIATFVNREAGYIWDAATGERLGAPILHGKDRRITQCVFSPDSRAVLTTGWDNNVRLWNADDGRQIWEAPMEIGISAAAFSPDGQRVVAAGFDMSALVLNAADGKLAWPVLRHGALVFSAFFDALSDRVVTTSENGVAQVWRWSPEQAASVTFDHHGAVSAAGLHPGNPPLAAASVGRQTLIWNPQTAQPVRVVPHPRPVVESVLSGDGKGLATLTEDGEVRVWKNFLEDAPAVSFEHDKPFTQLAINADASRVLTGSRAGAQLWDAAKRAPIGPEIYPGRKVLFTGFFPQRNCFVIGMDDGAALAIQAATGERMGQEILQKATVESADLSPDGRRLATGATDMTYSALGAFVWDLETGARLAGPLMHRDGVHLVRFSPDGRLLATAGEDAMVRVWNAATGEPITPPLPQVTRVMTLAFSADSRRLATGNIGGRARVWSAETGEALTPRLDHADRIALVAFLPGSQDLLAASADGQGKVWNLSRSEEKPAWLAEKAKILSAHRFDLPAGLAALDRAAISNAWIQLRNE